jgi:hypothetical protein
MIGVIFVVTQGTESRKHMALMVKVTEALSLRVTVPHDQYSSPRVMVGVNCMGGRRSEWLSIVLMVLLW